MTRKFQPALVYHRGSESSNEYGEAAPIYSGEPMPIYMAISVINGAFSVKNEIRAIRSTHVGLTECRTLKASDRILCAGTWYSIDYPNNTAPHYAIIYLQEVSDHGGGQN